MRWNKNKLNKARHIVLTNDNDNNNDADKNDNNDENNNKMK